VDPVPILEAFFFFQVSIGITHFAYFASGTD